MGPMQRFAALLGPLAALWLLFAATVPARAQGYGDGRDGVLAPTADVTLDTTANSGIFQFTQIQIPAGVTVRLVGPNPALLRCLGPASIAGVIDGDGGGSRWVGNTRSESVHGGPGGYPGGVPPHNGPGGGGIGIGIYPIVMGGSAAHATAGSVTNPFVPLAPTYGAALPFDLRGGSGGGDPGTHNQSAHGPPPSGGGGTIALLAGGAITVSGTIRVRGGDLVFGPEFLWNLPVGRGGLGSGGAILLRSLQGVRVSGTLDASGGELRLIGAPPQPGGGDGFVRIDSYSAYGPPDLAGATIRPTPFVAPLPYLCDLEPARIGRTYRVRGAAPPGDLLGYYWSPGTGVLAVPPFGVLELDPSAILSLGLYAVPTLGHDPLAVVDLAVPNDAALVGITLHSQVFNAFGATTGQARLSNRLVTTIGH